MTREPVKVLRVNPQQNSQNSLAFLAEKVGRCGVVVEDCVLDYGDNPYTQIIAIATQRGALIIDLSSIPEEEQKKIAAKIPCGELIRGIYFVRREVEGQVTGNSRYELLIGVDAEGYIILTPFNSWGW